MRKISPFVFLLVFVAGMAVNALQIYRSKIFQKMVEFFAHF